MKTQDRSIVIRVLAISVLCILSQSLFSQNPSDSHWEGDFMVDFKTIIVLEATGDDSYSGSIQMFDNFGEIQNDKLSKIKIRDKELSFYIEAKETEFKGKFDESLNELSGNFIFPDQSMHPIELQRVKPGESLSSE